MSFKTLEVDLENGMVHPSGAERLPTKAHALLTILTTAEKSEVFSGTLADRVARLAGIGQGKLTDLSSNKSHLNDFGR